MCCLEVPQCGTSHGSTPFGPILVSVPFRCPMESHLCPCSADTTLVITCSTTNGAEICSFGGPALFFEFLLPWILPFLQPFCVIQQGHPAKICRELKFQSFWSENLWCPISSLRQTVLGSSRGPCYQRDLPMSGSVC